MPPIYKNPKIQLYIRGCVQDPLRKINDSLLYTSSILFLFLIYLKHSYVALGTKQEDSLQGESTLDEILEHYV